MFVKHPPLATATVPRNEFHTCNAGSHSTAHRRGRIEVMTETRSSVKEANVTPRLTAVAELKSGRRPGLPQQSRDVTPRLTAVAELKYRDRAAGGGRAMSHSTAHRRGRIEVPSRRESRGQVLEVTPRLTAVAELKS